MTGSYTSTEKFSTTMCSDAFSRVSRRVSMKQTSHRLRKASATTEEYCVPRSSFTDSHRTQALDVDLGRYSVRCNRTLYSRTSPHSLNSPYSASKASSDHFVRTFHETYGFPTQIMNFSNSYEPRQFPEKFISLVILNALVCRPLPVYGTGFNIRDWLYFGEHCITVQCMLKSCRADL